MPLAGVRPAETYLDQGLLLKIAREERADAVHPGYGFLSENAGFAQAVIDAGLTFIGPSPRLIDLMGHKTRARQLMAERGLPVRAGSDVLADVNAARRAAAEVGYPVLLKPAGGGGGIGMLTAADDAALEVAFDHACQLAMSAFGQPEVYIEKLVQRPRHIELQIIADRHGNVAHLHERDCSTQRRHQKVIEEAPAPGLERADLEALAATAVSAVRDLGYDSIGTLELLRDADGGFGFLEMNTRLQVEHAVTEVATGFDLVSAQIRLAAGAHLSEVMPERPPLAGHAIEARVYAEDPHSFLPSPGTLHVFRPPRMRHVRVDTGYCEGLTVSPHYDPLLAKVIAHGDTRPRAIGRLLVALKAFRIEGLKHNIPALLAVLEHAPFVAGQVHTGILADVAGRVGR